MSHLTLVASQPDPARIVSPDAFLYQIDGVYKWTPTRLKEAWAKAQRQFLDILRTRPAPRYTTLMVGLPNSGKSTWLRECAEPLTLYFDSSLTRVWQRRWFIEASYQYGIAPDCVWIDTPCPVLLERNGKRSHERHVPTKKLLAMWDDFEEPTLQEGFKSIVRVPYVAPEPSTPESPRDCA